MVEDINKISNFRSTDLSEVEDENGEMSENIVASNILDGKQVKFIGIISEVKKKITKNNEVMAFVTIEDLEGAVSLIAFPKTYAGYKNVIFEDNIVKVDGRINVREDEVTVMISRIETYEKRQNDVLIGLTEKSKKISLTIDNSLGKEKLTELRNFIKLIGNQKTNTELEITNKDVTKIVKVYVNEKIYTKLQELAGEKNICWQ